MATPLNRNQAPEFVATLEQSARRKHDTRTAAKAAMLGRRGPAWTEEPCLTCNGRTHLRYQTTTYAPLTERDEATLRLECASGHRFVVTVPVSELAAIVSA